MAPTTEATATSAGSEERHEETGVPVPIVTLATCFLRPVHASDAPVMARLANNPKVAANLRAHFPSPYHLSDAEYWIAKNTGAETRAFAICDAATGAYCGGIGLIRLTGDEARTAEVGYWLGEPYWGRGIMSDAVAGFARWCFATMPEHELLRLEAHAYSFNGASQRVLTKAGFVYEGSRRKAGFKNGQVFDITSYGLLREDLQ